MRIPVWLTLGVAIIVIAFGAYRIKMSMRSPEEDARAKERGGLYGMGKRTHLLVGIVYLLLGAGLIATSFGWNPFGDLIGPDTIAPTKDTQPTSTGIPKDGVPTK